MFPPKLHLKKKNGKPDLFSQRGYGSLVAGFVIDPSYQKMLSPYIYNLYTSKTQLFS